MFKRCLFLTASLLLLASCNRGWKTNITEQLDNPFVAARYGDMLADGLADIVINDDPLLKENGMRRFIDDEIVKAKQIATDGRVRMQDGMRGTLLPMKQDVHGLVLYYSDKLYFAPEFETAPGPSLHVYLTTVVDPRDIVFPDNTALDLGEIQSAYGAQVYSVPPQEKPELYRTVALWDTKLKRLYGFAQIGR